MPKPSDSEAAGAPRRITLGRRIRITVIAGLYSFVWAVLCDFLLEMSVWRAWSPAVDQTWPGTRDDVPAWYEVFSPTYGLWLGSLVIWLVLLLILSLINRYWLSLGLVLAAALALAVAGGVKADVRHEPLYPSDIDFLSDPTFLATMVPLWQLAAAGIGCLMVVAGAVAVGRRLDRTFPRLRLAESRTRWVTAVVGRVTIAGCTALALVSATDLNDADNVWGEIYEADAAHWRPSNQLRNYRDHGFVGGFLYNMSVSAMAQPQGYSASTMAKISERYSKIATQMNRDRDFGALDDVNVVVVLSEAFSDPTKLAGISMPDPIPRTRATMRSTMSGPMLAQIYGGGTANMEFEALTGQSMNLFAPQLSSPYQMLIPEFDDFPSAVGWFRGLGHHPIAIHPYFASMYKRTEVYRKLGFEEFIDEDKMQSRERVEDSDFVSDNAAFDEVLHQIASNPDPLLVNLVSMQNHFSPKQPYADLVPVNGSDDEGATTIGSYARGLTYTDVAIEAFLTALRRSPEHTIVVFYGDHQPGIYDDQVVRQNPEQMYQTSFFIWDSEGNRPLPQPLTSPIHFLPLVLEVLDAPVPPFYAMLNQLRASVSAMETDRYVTPTGDNLSRSELDPAVLQVLRDVELVQYDFSVGERYALDEMWYDGD